MFKWLNKDRLGNKRFNIICMLIYKVIFEMVFVFLTSKIYGYIGLNYDPNYQKLFVSYFIAIILIIVMPNYSAKVSSYLIYIFYYFTIMPLLCIFWLQNQSGIYIFFCTFSFCVLCAGTSYFAKMNSKFSISFGTSKLRLEETLLIVSVMMLLVITIRYGLPNFGALDFGNIYSIRAEKSYGGLWAYLINWETKAIFPCLIGISLYRKKRAIALLGCAMQFYMFLVTANKTVLFSIFFIVGIYFLINLFENKCMYYLALGLGILNAIGLFLYTFARNNFIFFVVSYRLSAVPANISFAHFNFFSENPKLLFSETFIGRLFGFRSPYTQASTYMLGYNGSNANTGILGDAYDNGGFVVMILYFIILALIMVWIDKKVQKIADKRFVASVVTILSYTIINLNDLSLTVTLITGGLIITLVIISIFVNQEYNHSVFREDSL